MGFDFFSGCGEKGGAVATVAQIQGGVALRHGADVEAEVVDADGFEEIEVFVGEVVPAEQVLDVHVDLLQDSSRKTRVSGGCRSNAMAEVLRA